MILSPIQESYINNYVEEILKSLPPKAVQELLSGYENDLEKLLISMKEQVSIVTNMDRTIDIEKLEYLSNMEQSMDLSLRKLSYNYFKTTMLPGFRQGWRNLEWGNLFLLYPYNGLLASRGSGKCFSPDTDIVMYDGSIRKIKDIRIGDRVMGVDSTPRTVLSIHKGEAEMYEVDQSYAIRYICKVCDLILCNR